MLFQYLFEMYILNAFKRIQFLYFYFVPSILVRSMYLFIRRGAALTFRAGLGVSRLARSLTTASLLLTGSPCRRGPFPFILVVVVFFAGGRRPIELLGGSCRLDAAFLLLVTSRAARHDEQLWSEPSLDHKTQHTRTLWANLCVQAPHHLGPSEPPLDKRRR